MDAEEGGDVTHCFFQGKDALVMFLILQRSFSSRRPTPHPHFSSRPFTSFPRAAPPVTDVANKNVCLSKSVGTVGTGGAAERVGRIVTY